LFQNFPIKKFYKNFQKFKKIKLILLELNSNEESLYANRSLCYKNLGKYKLSLYDLNKALELSPRNIKYLKRLANIQMIYGNLGESLSILQKCINLEPREPEHKSEYEAIQKKIKSYELMEERVNKMEFVKAEEIAEKLVKDCSEFLALKTTYIKILLENLKLQEAIKFIMNNISSDEKNDEIDYLLALGFYYDGN